LVLPIAGRYPGAVSALALHDSHARWGGTLGSVHGCEVVFHYGDVAAEHGALREAAAALDLGFRTRLVVMGTDRDRFLNGQVTNDLRRLEVGQGCYAAIVNARGKMDGDAGIYRLPEEWLLDCEPGLTETLSSRLERHVVAEEVRMLDATPHYGLLSVQGPKAEEVIRRLLPDLPLPPAPYAFASFRHPAWGESYCMNQPRLGRPGYDLHLPAAGLVSAASQLDAAVRAVGGRWAGWEALETARVEAGIPRFGADMDNTTLPPEAGIESRAISYAKGCYIGQEIIARIRTYGQVARTLRGLRLTSPSAPLPDPGDPLLLGAQVMGKITSAVRSPVLGVPIALGYVRRECQAIGTVLEVRSARGGNTAEIVPLPFLTP